ncbi:hypothetical protein EVAR_25049_1 [Eumeta japonica]|uniref:Mariner Mos1 transposase n=1 Tax=Eumeta variegata TaxID=151549 RepID=A0A4C1V7J4_EUMVA|nr:hypothetical protein EVAR_25049_1 [Eumeta japonica]
MTHKASVEALDRTMRYLHNSNYAMDGCTILFSEDFLTKHLSMKKLCSQWTSHLLSEAQKTDRVTWYSVMFTRFKEGASNLVWDIVTSDGTWIPYRSIEMSRNQPKWRASEVLLNG